MNRSQPSRTVIHLSELKRSGSARHKASQEPEVQCLRSEPAEIKKMSVWNLDRWWRRIRKSGAVQQELHSHELDQRKELAEFQSDTETQTGKYAAELQQTLVDEGLEKRAQRMIRASNVRDQIQTTDAMELVTLYADRGISRIRKEIKESDLQEALIDAVKTNHAHAMTLFRIVGAGLEYGPDAGPSMEDLS